MNTQNSCIWTVDWNRFQCMLLAVTRVSSTERKAKKKKSKSHSDLSLATAQVALIAMRIIHWRICFNGGLLSGNNYFCSHNGFDSHWNLIYLTFFMPQYLHVVIQVICQVDFLFVSYSRTFEPGTNICKVLMFACYPLRHQGTTLHDCH